MMPRDSDGNEEFKDDGRGFPANKSFKSGAMGGGYDDNQTERSMR